MNPLVNCSLLVHYASLLIGRTSPTNDSQRRYSRLFQTALAAVAGKGIAMVVNFISVPLTINYLGIERYGVWITISTLLTWLMVADLGLNNTLTNVLSDAYAKNQYDAAKKYISTVLAVLLGLALFLAVFLTVVWRWVNWAELFNVSTGIVKTETSNAIIVAFGIFLVNFPFTILPKIYGAYQEGSIANYWNAAANLLSLLALVIITKLEGGLVELVVAIMGTQVLVNWISALWLFLYYKPHLRPAFKFIDRASLISLSRLGSMFFVVQIAGLLLFQTDNIIIAHFLGVSEVTPYSVTWRLFMYTAIMQTMILPALWPAYTEAFARNDKSWVLRTFRIEFIVNTLITGILAIILVSFGRLIIKWWTGQDVAPTQSLLNWMGAWSIIFSMMNSTSCVLNSLGHLRGQTIYATMTALSNVILSILLVQPLGLTGIIAATVMSFLVFNVIPSFFEIYLIFKGSTNKLRNSTE